MTKDVAKTPPADRFRINDIWRSPRDKEWKVEKVDPIKGAFLRAVHNRHTTQWRPVTAIGNNITDAWWRVHPDANY
jgi:hypothetical protein